MDAVDRTFSSPDFDVYARQNIEESNLLATIERRLLPEEQERFSYLVDKMETPELTEVENSELMAYVERVEREDAERARALVKLAEIRNVSPEVLLALFLSGDNHTDPARGDRTVTTQH